MMVETLAPVAFAVLLFLIFLWNVWGARRKYTQLAAEDARVMSDFRQQTHVEDGHPGEGQGQGQGQGQEGTATNNVGPVNDQYDRVSAENKKLLENKIGDMIGRYFSLFLLITYLILPGVTTRIAGVITTVNVDPDGVTNTPQRFMRNDLQVSYLSHRYRFGIIWAITFIIVYPIGVPLLYLYVLHYHKAALRAKDNSSNVVAAVARGDSQGSGMGASSNSLSMGPTAAGAVAVAGDNGNGNGNGNGLLSSPTSVPVASADGHIVSSDSSRGKGKGTCKDPCSWLKLCFVPEGKNIMDYITPDTIYFLHGAYEGQFWYWEVVETLRRILLTAVVSVVSPGKMSLSISYDNASSMLFQPYDMVILKYLDRFNTVIIYLAFIFHFLSH
jgi:hypothetical protein